MPPVTKRRKVSAITTRSLTYPTPQQGIHAFGKISKSRVQDPGKSVSGKKGTAIHGKDNCRSENTKKRKVGSACSPTDKEEGEEVSSLSEQIPPIDDSSKAVERSAGSPTSTPFQITDSRRKARLASTPLEIPTKGARSCLDSLALASSSPSNPSSSSYTTDRETPPSSPVPAESESDQLPDELQYLVDLHSSFLTALTLHYAHNGSMIPADLRNLGPAIERAWRKRRVTTDDVRRILAIGQPERADGQARAGPLYLSDYGHGKICVEIADNSESLTTTRRPLNEEVLNADFVRGLEQRWTCYKTNTSAEPFFPKFLASLALLPITPCTSLSKLTPLLSKGQRRLEDLKVGAIKAKHKPLSVTSADPTTLAQPKAKQTSGRSTDLFSRLKAKQLYQSTLPLPPSAEDLARKSAIQRLHEITPVLESLASSSVRHANDDAAAAGFRTTTSTVSFTMPTLVQHLQMSLRNPIGKEEVIRSVRMLAEVAPEWVGLKEVGRMLGVTVKGLALKKDELGRRVESLLQKL